MKKLTFRGLTLDRFQVESIEHIDKHLSVVVSAATGTGKTLIADYVIDRAFKRGSKVFYTSPIKALSNQKFSEFKKLYGEESVGILTGDVVINPGAPLIIMTTEIYRNMLLAQDPITDDLAAVVFDEIHYLGDVERGTVWEESIIFSPEHVRFLCLSATIPNAKQFADWISSISGHTVKVVTERKRAVPLKHGFFDNRFGLSSLEEIQQRKKKNKYPKLSDRNRGRRRGRGRYVSTRGRPANMFDRKLTHLDLIKRLKEKGQVPCIYFCFSRLKTEEKAEKLAARIDFIPKKKAEARKLVDKYMEEMDTSIAKLETTRVLTYCLQRGIGFHHAGLLPILKELVEQFFAQGLLSVLYATETFAVGINLPAKAVCFDSLEKYDGIHFRYLKSKEYFQLAGRAGRRGMDKVGFVYTYLDPEFADLGAVARVTASDSEALESQYKLSYNTILNLIANHKDRKERETILRQSFYTYQQKGKKGKQILKEYEEHVKSLIDLEYIESDGQTLTYKGQFARKIYQHELMLTELFTTTLTGHFSDLQIIMLCAALEYEPRPRITFKKGASRETGKLLELFKPYREIFVHFKKSSLRRLEPILTAWVNGVEFAELLDLTTMPEGDIIRFFRRIIDVLQQIRNATVEESLKDQVTNCIQSIDRDIVKVRL